MRLALAALGVVLLVGGPAQAQHSGLGEAAELVDRTTLRVCADPNNMPFSNQAEEGFENRIAELLAARTGRREVDYTWFPQATGFVRNTLGQRLCDVIIGYAQGDELVQNTNAYYRTAYSLVVKPESGLAGIESLADPRLQDKRIGVVARTPPTTNLAAMGMMRQAKSYPLMVDTRVTSPAKMMMQDLQAGVIDVAVMWGPMAGYHARRVDPPLTVVPLVNEKGGSRMAFRITMGVRATDQEWKRELNRFIRENQSEINAILLEYGVPLLDESNRPLTE